MKLKSLRPGQGVGRLRAPHSHVKRWPAGPKPGFLGETLRNTKNTKKSESIFRKAPYVKVIDLTLGG